MIIANDLRYGNIIKIDNILYIVLENQHVKPGKGPAYVKVKLKNFLSGNVIEKTLRSSEKVEDVRIERKEMQFLYRTDAEYIFLDNQTYEQISISKEIVGDSFDLLKEGMNIELLFYEDKPITISLPTTVELKVVSTEPGVRGDTVSTPLKPAVLETGLKVMVPLFIKEGDIIKIDTRIKTYIERA